MEKLSSLDRVVGSISEAEKEQILRDRGERFSDQVFEDLRGKEREKTPKELRIISLANEATNEIRQKYGLEGFDIPSENIHIIFEKMWPKEKSVAFFSSTSQAVAMREALSSVAFMKKVVHEMLHFKSYDAAQITTGENPELDEYRLGLTVRTRDGKRTYFTTLNEAVTEEMTKRLVKKLLDNQLFTGEIKQTKDIIRKHPQAITASDEPLFDEDTFYAEIQGNKSWRESADRLFGTLFGSGVEILTESFTYKQEGGVLNILIDKIFQRNPNKFQDKEEVFEVFAKGMITGNIVPVGRLIERTFGNGTLRQIGELDQDMQAHKKFVDSL